MRNCKSLYIQRMASIVSSSSGGSFPFLPYTVLPFNSSENNSSIKYLRILVGCLFAFLLITANDELFIINPIFFTSSNCAGFNYKYSYTPFTPARKFGTTRYGAVQYSKNVTCEQLPTGLYQTNLAMPKVPGCSHWCSLVRI